jgi:hypothetical protein
MMSSKPMFQGSDLFSERLIIYGIVLGHTVIHWKMETDELYLFGNKVPRNNWNLRENYIVQGLL